VSTKPTPPQPVVTMKDEKGNPVTVTFQEAWTAMVQHLIEIRSDLLALQLEVKSMKNPPEKLM
jgi:hypothetical protein